MTLQNYDYTAVSPSSHHSSKVSLAWFCWIFILQNFSINNRYQCKFKHKRKWQGRAKHFSGSAQAQTHTHMYDVHTHAYMHIRTCWKMSQTLQEVGWVGKYSLPVVVALSGTSKGTKVPLSSSSLSDHWKATVSIGRHCKHLAYTVNSPDGFTLLLQLLIQLKEVSKQNPKFNTRLFTVQSVASPMILSLGLINAVHPCFPLPAFHRYDLHGWLGSRK